jgi:hypothetical protein
VCLNIEQQIVQALQEWGPGVYTDLSDDSLTKMAVYLDEIYHTVVERFALMKESDMELWLTFSQSVYFGDF